MKRCFLLTLFLLMAAPTQADVYKWEDPEGKVHYSDQPPPPNARKIERRRVADIAADPSMPYVLQEAVKNFPVTIYVYDCGDGCAKAQALLSKRGVPHTTKDPLDPAAREELKKLTGGEEVAPVLQVGRRVLRGFEEGQWNSALDIAGYPPTALIKLPPAKPAAVPSPAPVAQGEPGPEQEAPEGAEGPGTAEVPAADETPTPQ
jgi:hypothetical protein